jgi:hypothetical protein
MDAIPKHLVDVLQESSKETVGDTREESVLIDGRLLTIVVALKPNRIEKLLSLMAGYMRESQGRMTKSMILWMLSKRVPVCLFIIQALVMK